MKKVIKKELPDDIINKLERTDKVREDTKTYYIIDDQIYVHTMFFIDPENMSLTMIHDLTLVEAEMIKDMKARNKVHFDEEGKPYFDLLQLSLWFFWKIPSRDYLDLMQFLRIIVELNDMDKYISVNEEVETN